ncbi:MAG: hypothetical protein LPK20_06085 [Halomonas sp.]|jgi:hypothetical protein|uniref:Uncharacterized protein n=1 Tax=Billgrantia tianxiuensis TaxID=2497861 RepID=A0A6I6SL86_9GAMM|nr:MULTISPECIES: hypothetical protein [Halomonas]MCE8034452.1 hypothetical protein [Halomonas sp. MCCC 1A11057]MDX5433120.1 hypothetical protein [Halomonas sp.]QHC50342.1 hypothetical protein EKK97_13175 [Halomonas tianxiuensis]
MTKKEETHAVRVWLGYALPELASGTGRERFYQHMGEIFIPATVQSMAPQGLQAYVPSILPPCGHPKVPDEVALVFYPSRQCYQQASHASVAGRAYGALHGTVFSFQAWQDRPASHSDFPVPFEGQPEQSGPVQLFDSGGNWQQGDVCSEVWLRGGQGVAAFRQGVCEAMKNLYARPRQGLLGVYYYLDDDLLVAWSHWQQQGQVLQADDIGELVWAGSATAVTVPSSPFADYAGLTVGPGQAFNLQFPLSPVANEG